MLKSSARERKYSLASILATNIVKFSVKLFLLTSRAHIIGFFYLEIAKKNRYDIDKIFCFKLISGFEILFWVFRYHEWVYHTVYNVL